MRLLVTADLHLTDNPRDEYRWEFMDEFAEIARNRKLDRIVILGDLTEEKDNHGARLVNRMARLLYRLGEICPVFIMMGNHDYHNEGHPFFAFVDLIPSLIWVDHVKEHRLMPGCLFLPHTRNYKKDWANVKLTGHQWVFAHNTFTGAEIGFGRGLEGIPLDVFPETIRVVAGDVHKPQRLGPVTYVGPPYTVDYGDDYRARLLLLEHDKAKSVIVDGYPQKRLIEVALLAELDGASKHVNAGDIVQVRVTVESMERWKEAHDYVIEWCSKRSLIANLIKPVLMSKRKVKRYKVTSKADDLELLEQYGKRHDLTNNTLNVGKALCDE